MITATTHRILLKTKGTSKRRLKDLSKIQLQQEKYLYEIKKSLSEIQQKLQNSANELNKEYIDRGNPNS